jgi:hypothetical protein
MMGSGQAAHHLTLPVRTPALFRPQWPTLTRLRMIRHNPSSLNHDYRKFVSKDIGSTLLAKSEAQGEGLPFREAP